MTLGKAEFYISRLLWLWYTLIPLLCVLAFCSWQDVAPCCVSSETLDLLVEYREPVTLQRNCDGPLLHGGGRGGSGCSLMRTSKRMTVFDYASLG